MAPVIQPGSLYGLCVKSLSNSIDHACTNIFLEHGCYGNEDCLRAVAALQSYVVSQLPTSIFERLSEDRNAFIQSQPLWSKDARIKLGVFLHPSISSFSVDGRGNELSCHGGHHDDGLDEFFWCAQIRRLGNLVQLNLNLITTDDILLLVGESCPKLEIVNVVSRIKQDISVHDHGSTYPGPGITLKFCVSDVGLRALLKCRQLRRITMNKILNHSSASHGISLSGVRALVRGLPKLEFINFGSIGKLLEGDDNRPLRLGYFSELDPTFVSVPRLQQLCPNVQHISLSVPINVNANGFINTNLGPCNQILTALAESSLLLRVVELQHYPYGEPFKALLRNKGGTIEELIFRANGQLHSQHLAFIGEHCPRLQKLHLKEMGAEETPFGFTAEMQRMRLFQKLTFAHISGRMWNPNVILPLLLSAASEIKQIYLLNMYYRLPMDGAILRLLQFNKLSELVSINLYSGCFLSMSVIRQLSYGCPRLNYFSFLQFDGFEIAEVETLKVEMEAKNLEMKLNCLEMYDH